RCSAAPTGPPCGTSNGSRRTRCRRCCGRSWCRPADRGTCSRCRPAARDDDADRRSAARARARARRAWPPPPDRGRRPCRGWAWVRPWLPPWLPRAPIMARRAGGPSTALFRRVRRGLVALAAEEADIAELHAQQLVEPDVDHRRDVEREELRHQQAADDG